MKSSAAPGLALMVLGCMGRLAGVSWHCDAVMAGYGHAPAMAADSLTLAGGGQHHRPPKPVSQKYILAHLLLAVCFPTARGCGDLSPSPRGLLGSCLASPCPPLPMEAEHPMLPAVAGGAVVRSCPREQVGAEVLWGLGG